MAKRRMFSLQIVDSDAFLDMPQTSQLLYFHLSMRADDEGFVGNPKKIMRMVGTSEDDMKILLAKRFILAFQSGVVVIKHWLIHNTIRMDRFAETVYKDEKLLLDIKDNKAYTEWQPNGNHLATQVKLSKVKLIKDNSEQSSPISLIRKYFTEKCKELKGFEPEMAFGKEGKLLKEKLTRFSAEQIKDLIDKFFNSKIGEDLGYTLSICLSAPTINQWQGGKLERAKKPFYRGNPMVKMQDKWKVSESGEWLEFAGKEAEIEWK
jgi:hypothetical protein